MEELNGLRLADRKHIGLAEMLKGGVIMDVTNAEQAKIAEDAGAASVMALERVPSDIRRDGGVARMSPVKKIQEIQKAVTIPVMAKARIGHFVEAQILEALGVDYIDESEVLTPADEHFHIDKFAFRIPFVCGCRDLGEALRRIGEGAAMIRTKGEAGSGNIVEAVRHMRAVMSGVKRLTALGPEELMTEAKNLGAPYELVRWIARTGKLPVPNFSAGGIATPADAALMMQLGAEAVFVGSGIFKSADPAKRAKAIVQATTHFKDPDVLVQGQRGPRRGHGRARDREAGREGPDADARLVVGGSRDEDRRPRSAGRLRPPRGGARAPSAVEAVEVRKPEQLDEVDGLIIPGGESTTLLKLMDAWGFVPALEKFHAGGKPIFGTCAGLILTAREVENPAQFSLGFIDVGVERNAYGRQRESFATPGTATLDGTDGAGRDGVHPRAAHPARGRGRARRWPAMAARR